MRHFLFFRSNYNSAANIQFPKIEHSHLSNMKHSYQFNYSLKWNICTVVIWSICFSSYIRFQKIECSQVFRITSAQIPHVRDEYMYIYIYKQKYMYKCKASPLASKTLHILKPPLARFLNVFCKCEQMLCMARSFNSFEVAHLSYSDLLAGSRSLDEQLPYLLQLQLPYLLLHLLLQLPHLLLQLLLQLRYLLLLLCYLLHLLLLSSSAISLSQIAPRRR